MGDVKWCLRLIWSQDERLVEEVIDDRDPGRLRLGCAPLKVEALEDARRATNDNGNAGGPERPFRLVREELAA